MSENVREGRRGLSCGAGHYPPFAPHLPQAKMCDADGRGVPSAERLLKAVILATPAIAVSTAQVAARCGNVFCAILF